MKIAIEAMNCGGCARSVTKAVQSVDPAATVTPDLASREIEVTTDKSQADVLAALEAAGYPGIARAA